MKAIQVGIVGGTGYTGVELLRLLVNHPLAEVKVITSRAENGVRVDQLYPSLRGFLDLQFSVPDVDTLASCDLVFFATPHGVAQAMMRSRTTRVAKVHSSLDERTAAAQPPRQRETWLAEIKAREQPDRPPVCLPSPRPGQMDK